MVELEILVKCLHQSDIFGVVCWGSGLSSVISSSMVQIASTVSNSILGTRFILVFFVRGEKSSE